jgi:hypothetical protein
VTLDIAGFYAADPRRDDSEEVLYGDGWTTPEDPHSTYRCQWVVDTGELYTVREPHPGGILARYLDQLHIDQADVSELTVDVLRIEPDRAVVDALLDGWPAAMEAEDSLAWLIARARRL